MATAPQISAPEVDPVLQIPVGDIEIGPRIGFFWPAKAAALGKLMAVDGQRDPIKIRKNGPRAAKPWTLVAGLHRLEGAIGEALPTIEAIQVYGDDQKMRDIEASENLHRRSFGPLERACFVRAIADAAEERVQGNHEGLTPAQIAVRARWDKMRAKVAGVVREDELAEAEADHTSANIALVYGWADETADALAMSRRSMFLDLALHRALIAPFPALYRDLATHPIVGENASALKEIAAVKDEGVRRQIITDLVNHPALTLGQAKERAGIASAAPVPASGATKYMNNATANLARLSAADQRALAPAIVETLKPTALIALREALDARIAAEAPAPQTPAEEQPVPAVSIRQSVKPDYIACLECGEKLTMLKRHLMTDHQLTKDAYLAKWKLPRDYPMVAPNYAEERRQMARKIGLKGGEA